MRDSFTSAAIGDRGGNAASAAAPAVFDPALAAHTTRVLDCDALVDPLHVTDSPDTVRAYAAAMRRGDRFPPVSVVRLFGTWFVADGHKRLGAYRMIGARGARHIVVEVWPVRRWLRDQAEQAAATGRRWRAVLARRPGALSPRRAVSAEVAHLRRIVVSLARGWTSPGPARATRPRGVAARLFATALRHRREIALTAAGFLALSATQLALTWLVKVWIDGPLSHAAPGASGILPALTVLSVCVLSAAVFVAHYGLGSLHTRVIRDLRGELQARLLRLDVAALQASATGDLSARLLQDADVAGRFPGEIVRRGLGDAIVFAGALIMLLVIDRQLFARIVLIAPLGVIGHTLVATVIRRRSLAAQRRLGELSARFGEQLGGHRTVKGYRGEHAERQRFERENRAHAEAVAGVERWSAFALSTIWLVTGFAALGVGAYASHALGAGRLAAGDFLVFCLFGAQMVEPVRRLGELSTLAQRSLAAGQRLYEVLDRGDAERCGGNPLPRPFRGAVCFEAVRHAYAPDGSVLAGVTFDVAAGETVAVVSPSGGGKSTMAALLVGFFAPDSGTIRLDGEDLASLRLDDVRAEVKVVAQDPFLFSGTVLDNIRYGTEDAPAAAVREAVRRAGLEAWVGSLPDGLRTRLEEAGRNLSGGQKQRIALARAIVAEPRVLVLDEATSAVDGDAEEQIMAGLEDWLRQRTVILMAHRLATVLRVPRALVLEAGRIVEDGPPRELLRGPTRFAAIFGDQRGAGVARGVES